MIEPLVTAIVSTYAAERFIRDCMDDLVAQTIFAQLEILVIDSGSPENESAIVDEYVAQYPEHVRLIRTEREPLYVAWNRAIGLARGKYLTNANTDDRHRSDAFECLANVLDTKPNVGLVFADQYISESENESFEECKGRNAQLLYWTDFTNSGMILNGISGSQPMWRSHLHEDLGRFDTSYTIAADYDMWLRIAQHHDLIKLDDICGVMLMSPTTISGSDNRWLMNKENLEVQRRYICQSPWSEIKGIRQELASGIFARGYMHIEQDNDAVSAAPFIRESIKLDPLNVSYLKTYLYRCVLRRFM